MDKKQYVPLVVAALVAGLVGGAVSSWLFRGPLVFTQKPTQREKVIQAEGFEAVDERGKLRARFGIGELTMYDEAGLLPHLELTVFQGKPSLTLYGKAMAIRATLTLRGDGTPDLKFYNKDGTPGASLVLVNGDAAELELDSGTNAARLSVNPRLGTGSAALDLTSQNPSGQRDHGVYLAAYESGPSLSLSSGASVDVKKDIGKQLLERAEIDLGIGAEGPSVTLKDNDGKERATLGQTDLEITRTGSTEKRAASSPVLFDKQGKVIWRAP